MWTRLARSFRSEAVADGTEWLEAPYKPHLYTLILEQAADPLDADALWEDRYGGGADIVEKRSRSPRLRLRAALDSQRRVISKPDARGKRVPMRYVYSDIVVGINQAVWRKDLMIGADGLESLAHNLAFRHREDFQNSLLPGRDPRYVVVPRADLATHQVSFQFGYGVFVPGPNDRPEAELRLRYPEEATGSPFPAWVFVQAGQLTERPVGLYGEQHFLLLAGPLVNGPVAAPGWFSQGQGYILLTRDPSLGWQAFADEEFVRFEGARPGPGGLLELRFSDAKPAQADAAGQVLVLEIRSERPATGAEPQAGSPSLIPAEPGKKPAQPEADWGETVIPGLAGGPVLTLLPERRIITQYPYALLLEGVALPRIDGRWAIPGLQSWILWLDEDGDPIQRPLSEEQAARLPALCAVCERGALYSRALGERRFDRVKRFPHRLKLADEALEIVAAALPERYLGILHLPHPVEILLDSRPLKLGRGGNGPVGEPRIALNQLSQPASLRWQPGRAKTGRLGDIGLSRQHLQVQVSEGRLQLGMAEGKTPVYVLDDRGGLRHTLPPGSAETVTLPPGERLLVGNYLLRFVKTDS